MRDAIRSQFEEFVQRELGDVPVMDNGRYISQKINNYWRTWQAAQDAAIVWCDCGDGIVSNDGAVCGTCAAVKEMEGELRGKDQKC